MPTVWGSRAHSSKALPPLKSTSTNVRWSGSTLAARPATSDAQQLGLARRRWCRRPGRGGRRPRSRRRTRRPRPCPPASAGRGSTPPAFQRASDGVGRALVQLEQRQQADRGGQAGAHEVELGVLEAGQGPGAARGPRRRPCPRAGSRSMRWPRWGRLRSAPPSGSVSSTTVVHTAGRRSTVEAMTMPATGPASPRSRVRVGALRPSVSDSSSTTTSRVGPTGRAAAGGAAARPVAAAAALRRASTSRVDSSGSSDSRRPDPAGVAGVGQPLGPVPRPRAASGRARTITGRSAGPCRAAAWHSSERARASGRGAVADDADHPAVRQVDRHGAALGRWPASASASAISSGGSAELDAARRAAARARRPPRPAGRRKSAVRRAGAPTAWCWAASTRRMISAGSG